MFLAVAHARACCLSLIVVLEFSEKISLQEQEITVLRRTIAALNKDLHDLQVSRLPDAFTSAAFDYSVFVQGFRERRRTSFEGFPPFSSMRLSQPIAAELETSLLDLSVRQCHCSSLLPSSS